MADSLRGHVHIAIAGAGFAGIGMAIRLKQKGIGDFLVFERADDVGGVWRDNSYPGCACDVQSHLYSFSFAPNPDWSRAYSPQEEIWAYLRGCARRFGLLPHIRFRQEIRRAVWQSDERRWRLETPSGVYTADVLVGAFGALSEPSLPRLPGLEAFEGRAFHSARWDHDYDLAGRRVAVVGTGASAIQLVPAIQPRVRQLVLFQRTAPWIVPRNDRALGERQKWLLGRSRLLGRAVRLSLYASREMLGLPFLHPSLARLGEQLALRHLERSVPDPALRAKLVPTYRFGCKRVLVSDDYLPALTRPNVEVVTGGIREVRRESIVANDGSEHPVDAIVFGTGFRVTNHPFADRLTGRDGRTLAEVWDGSPRAHLGTTVAGFPNLFLLLGPNTGLGHTSVLLMIESQIEHVLAALRFMRRRGVAAVEPRAAAQAAFNAEVDDRMRSTVWTVGGCDSWYLDRTGRNSALWPGYTFSFKRRVRHFDPAEYVAEPTTAGRPVLGTRSPSPSRVRPSQRALHLLGRALAGLPPRLQSALAGGGPIEVDGLTLSPEIQLILAARRWRGTPGLSELPPPEGRRQMRRETRVDAGRPLPVGAVRDLPIAGGAGLLRARHYAPLAPAGAPLLVYYHGGGFVLGDLETHDRPCRLLCRHGGMHVLSVDYRLAPEHPFPAAVEDAAAAFGWALAHAGQLGADPVRVAVGGDSAGANLAAVVSQMAVRGGGRAPAAQLLLYPGVDRTGSRPYRSMELFADGYLLTRADVEWFQAQCLGGTGADVGDVRVSPAVAEDLSGLPPALVATAGFDPLRDEGEAYARRMRDAGTPTRLRRYGGLVHGFIHMTGVSAQARAALVEVAIELGALLDAELEGAQAAVGAAATR